jgi:hypothetical protein
MKRNRSDSVTSSVRAAQNASRGELLPPAHVTLRECDLVFWNAIVRARAYDTWTDVDLAKAANLARCQADIERISIELNKEGDTLVNERGTVVVNPKHALLETLTRREIALSRAIHVHAEATVGKSEDAAKVLAAEKNARKANDNIKDDLIPKLYAV